ncbi:MAG: Holliday junction branch migration protein RuvA [Clostridiales bacterium]|jgi:holliday junction DNA helicase ruvA|nr:holliday junction ATP-dependent DNA helicase RuvA [Clostridium sp. CAG:567]
MLAYIKGILEIKTKGYIVVEAGGLGYKIFMPESTIAKTGNIGDKVQIHTFMRVREDDVSLYGFLTNEELRMFELLLSVSGIGAKGALGILSNITPSQFALAVISNDVAILKKVPGIGPKTAQRAILELKDKLKKDQEIAVAEGEEASNIEKVIKEDEKVAEAISALQVLGYSKREIVEALQNVELTSLSVEDIIRKGLANLSKKL